MEERQQLEQAIAAQESLRGTVDDAIIDATIATLKEKLATLEPAPSEQRKLATVLFMDIADHTTLTGNLDPEEQMALVEPILARFAARIEEFGGHIARYQGDGFKAVFGLPVARENDPQQAIRAGLAIQEEAGEIAGELKTVRGFPDFHVRVGIATGLVFAGGETEGEDTIKGAPVNLAARLESLAEPGSILVSHDTYQLARGLFDFELLEAVPVKGFAEPVALYRVLRAKRRGFYRGTRGIEGVKTRMIGREAEFIQLQKALVDMVEERDRQLVTIVGDAGIGKSRLIYEFENWVDLQSDNFLLYKGRARLETQGQPYGLIRDLFASHFEILDDDSAQVAREKLLQGIASDLGSGQKSDGHGHALGQLLGYDLSDSPHLQAVLDNPQKLRDQALHTLNVLFRNASVSSPVLLLFEDLHWADSASLDAVNQLALEWSDKPILILGTARPGLLERRPNWGEGQDFHRRIQLDPLSKWESRRLVAEVLQKVSVIPEDIQESVVGSSEGNPFYVEELIKLLIDDGVIVPGEVEWQVQTAQLTDVRVPATLTGVLQARLDGLPAEERSALQGASVIGRIFWDRALEHIQSLIADGDTEREITAILDELRARELVFRRETSAFAEAREYIFKHSLLREVTYESVLKRVREAYHGLVADWLIEHASDRIAEFTALIAEHLEFAGRKKEAIRYLFKAGKYAAARYANEEAIRAFSRALEINMTLPDTIEQVQLHRERGLIYEIMGLFEKAQLDLEFILGVARDTGDMSVEWRALLDLGKLWAARDYQKTGDYFRQALEIARRLEDPALLGRSLNRMGNWHVNAEQPHEGIGYHLEAKDIFDGLQDPRGQADTFDLLGLASAMRADPVASNAYYNGAINKFKLLNDQIGLVSSLTNKSISSPAYMHQLGYSAATLREGALDAEKAFEMARKIGWRAGESYAAWSLAKIYGAMGQMGKALYSGQKGLKIATEIEHIGWMSGANLALGWLHYDLLDWETAEEYLKRALQLAKDIDSQFFILNSSGILALVQMQSGDLPAGHTCLEGVFSQETPMITMGQRQCWAAMAELAFAEENMLYALQIVEKLKSTAASMPSNGVISIIWYLEAKIMLADRRPFEAENVLMAAIPNAKQFGEKSLLWRLYGCLGKAYKDQVKRMETNAILLKAQEIVEEIADTIPEEELQAKFLRRTKKILFMEGHV